MNNASSWLDDITSLLRDPLCVARDAARAGQRVIAYVGGDVPVELILAANALPVRLRGVADADTSRAERYLESSFTPETRAICEQWLRGDLDFIDAVVFPRSDDAAQRLYYYLCELQRSGRAKGPRPLLFDVSTISRTTSLDNTRAAVLRLATEINADLSRLGIASARVRARIAAIDKLQAARVASPTLLGSAAFNMLRAADMDWRDRFDAHLSNYTQGADRVAADPRILFAGNMPPDDRLHLAVEQSGGAIVREFIEHRHPESASACDSVDELALRHHRGQTLAQQMLSSTALLVSAARTHSAHGVILWAIEEDEALPWEVARQSNALRAATIPVLSLARQPWRADDAVLTQIADFAQSLRKSA